MPEIMSAEDLVIEIIGKYFTSSFSPERTRISCTSIIHSRDAAMLEKYKEAVMALYAWTSEEQKFRDIALDALDSAFAEMEGGKE